MQTKKKKALVSQNNLDKMEEIPIVSELSPDIILTIASFFFYPTFTNIFVSLQSISGAPHNGEFSKLELKESTLQVHRLTLLQQQLAESAWSYSPQPLATS